jgi:hypothetical protein
MGRLSGFKQDQGDKPSSSIKCDEVLEKLKLIKFDVCGSVRLGNICFIRIQLDVQYYFFLKSF